MVYRVGVQGDAIMRIWCFDLVDDDGSDYLTDHGCFCFAFFQHLTRYEHMTDGQDGLRELRR